MKIDIHTHTKKCKSGDAPTREIAPDLFCETIRSTDVGIIAITNHNVFDLNQYKEIQRIMAGDAQVWPGIELDVIEDGARGHLLVIVSPLNADRFFDSIENLTKDSTPDNFTTTIVEVVGHLDSLGPIYVAHYKQKKPNLSDAAIERLIEATGHPDRVIKEVANSISAGIFISHGHPSIYGSDLHDWKEYEEESRDLPDLRLPVESFEHFCLLLAKDPTTINTALNKKVAENLRLTPFDDTTVLNLMAFNDINIVFGPKGTGKSCILESIAKYYSENGTEAEVYVSSSDRLDHAFDTRGRDISLNLISHGIAYCKDEVASLRDAKEVGVTSLSKYVSFFRTKCTSRNAKKIKIKDIEPEGESVPKREFYEFHEAVAKTAGFLQFVEEHTAIRKELSNPEFTELTQILSQLLERLGIREWNTYTDWKEIHLLNTSIEKFREEVERKTGSPAKPSTTGFRDYALNRATIEASAAMIVKSIDSTIPMQRQSAGSLGPNKGELELCTEFVLQNGNITDGSLNRLKSIKKGSLKDFARKVRDIRENAYSDNLFQHISALNSIEDIEQIETVYELLLFKRYFALSGQPYTPSSGEASMVMLQKELEADKEVYILDEPEKSLGNEYINDVIVPLIRERAGAGKKIFISTHDANIAVRTLPYSSLYRCHGPEGYSTYIGNPFSNDLVNPEDDDDRLDWKKVSMRTLEGGEEAFGERGKIYGNH